MIYSKYYILFVVSLLTSFGLTAQAPTNDQCANAYEFVIGNNGYDFENLTSPKVNPSDATREPGEICSSAISELGNCEKTVWFKFTIPTNRDVSISLNQKDSAIPQIYVGFTIYEAINCSKTTAIDLSKDLIPITKFGLTGSGCTKPGTYYIQVSANTKTKGEIWVNLNIKPPNNDSFDNVEGAKQSNWGNFNNYSNKCNSIEAYEYDPNLPLEYTSAVWFKIAIPKTNHMALIADKDNFYKVFNGKPSRSQVKNSSLRNNDTAFYFYDACNKRALSDTLYILGYQRDWRFFGLKTIVESVSNNSEKDYNSPPTPLVINFGTTNAYDWGSKTTSCQKIFDKTHCPQLYNQIYEDTNSKIYSPNHIYPIFMVINASTIGNIKISSYGDLKPLLFEGDIRKTCNLKEIDLNGKCQYQGPYTLIFLSKKPESESISVSWTPQQADRIALHTKPQQPEILGNYDPNIPDKKVSQILYHRKTDTTVIIDGVTINGRLSFKEFDLAQSGSFTLLGVDCDMYLFKGSFVINNLKKIDGFGYESKYSNIGFIASYFSPYSGPYCNYLEKGTYTIVCDIENNRFYKTCSQDSFQTQFYGHPTCPKSNTEPALAIPLNNNKNILDIATKDAGSYSIRLKQCLDCSTKSITPFYNCNDSAESTNFYYTFKLDKAMGFNTRGQLFDGNILQNPNLIYDDNKRLTTCYDGFFCELAPNKIYTLVYKRKLFKGVFEAIEESINFYEFPPTPNDHQSNAIDFGEIQAGNSLTSPKIVLNCLTSLDSNELAFEPYDITTHKIKTNVAEQYSKHSLYYTFSTTQSLNFKLYLPNISSNDYYIYKLRDNSILDFNQIKNKGLDSNKSSYDLILKQTSYSNPTLTFNTLCEPARYFLIIKSRYPSLTDSTFTIIAEDNNLSSKGDQCSTPHSLNINALGKYQVQFDNACHGYGNTPIEPGQKNLKTSWIELNITENLPFKLSIKSLGYGYNFELYGGTCGALNKIVPQGNSQSYFTLNCMGSGKYYIYVFNNQYNNSNALVNFEITLEKDSNGGCKPYNFKNPLSYFNYNGGCNLEDTITLLNYSTKGEDIAYTWLLNEQFFSNLQSPQISRKNSSLKDTNTFTLITRNTILGLADTFSKVYVLDTTKYYYEILGNDSLYCFDTSILRINTNFPYAMKNYWGRYPLDDLGNAHWTGDSLVTVYNNLNSIYYTKGIYEGCVFESSFQFKNIKPFSMFYDTTLCEGQTLKLFADKGIYYVNNTYISSGNSYSINQDGVYKIQFRKEQYCYYTDTITVKYDLGQKLLTIKDAVFDCNKDSIKINYTGEKLIDYTWNTGSKKEFIDVKVNGSYNLKGSFTPCRALDYTANVNIVNLDTTLLINDTICKFGSIQLLNPYPAYLTTLPSSNPIPGTYYVTKPFVYQLSLQKDRCKFTDQAIYSLYPDENRIVDSLFCDSLNNFNLLINGGEAISYDWYNSSSTNQYLTVFNYGTYPVARVTKNNCTDTSIFKIINNCPFSILIPNAFTPNGDGLNDVFKPEILHDYETYQMYIYNRWGEKIFETNTGEGWNGAYQNKPAMLGSYTYLVWVKDASGATHHYTGVIELLR